MSDEPDLDERIRQAIAPSLAATDADYERIATALREAADRVDTMQEAGL